MNRNSSTGRSYARRGLGAPIALGVTGAVVATALLTAPAGHAAGPVVRPPGPPRAMIQAQRLVDAVDPGTGAGPTLNPADALADGQSQLGTQAATGAAASCGGAKVVTSLTGTGASIRVVIATASTSFAINAVPASWWRRPPVTTAVWLMYFRGLMWEQTVAKVALANNDTAAIGALVATAASSVAANPDPGTPAYGWDEGTNLRRQQSLNCLYRASNGDRRLVPAIVATAKANMDASRYYGLPYRLPHNHGVMANLALLDAGELLNNATWKSVAVSRLATDSRAAFTRTGVSIEQSAGYHVFNTNLWALVADTLATYPDRTISGAAPGIRAAVARARVATVHMTDPRGHLVPYGDGNDTTKPLTPQARGTFRDDAAGLVTGRWSWTDPMTSFYLLRYGSPRRAHGHQDRTALVWTTLGVPVLIDPGDFTYDPGPFNSWQSGVIAHNVQFVNGRAPNLSATVALGGTTTSGPVHAFGLTDSLFGVAHVRGWRIDSARHRVTLTDRTAAAAVTTLHFDLSWNAVRFSADHRTLTLRHPATGRIATVVSSTPMTLYRQSTRPLLGWQFPAYGQRTGSVQLLLYTAPGTTTTIITVS